MLPIVFEIPEGEFPRAVLAGCWDLLERGFRGECGGIFEEPPIDAGGLYRVIMEVPLQPRAYTLLLDALTCINVWARRVGDFPSLYESGVRYLREPPGLEIWASTPALYARGVGDCEDLACDRAGDLVACGVPARAILRQQGSTPNVEHWHVLVAHPNGAHEDPSAYLGME